MCGIVGIVAPNISSSDQLKFIADSMANCLVHRGPDAHGVWLSPDALVALSHRRLSIIDLSPAGHQPMVSASGRFHIVFNGEIYNFQLLASQLIQLGRRFRGHSDTEVLLEAIEEWGIESALQRCVGMFALAVWDTKTRELMLARDRMGEKPLFFGWVEKHFVFASELKAIKKVFPNSLSIDSAAQGAFFRFGYVPTPHSIYKNIFKLQPGTYLRIPDNSLPRCETFSPFPESKSFSPQYYWKLEVHVREGLENPIVDEQQAIDTFDELLRSAITQQRVADVPVGAFLSGGIDSSLVSAVMQAVSDRPIQTFTIGFKEKEFDEAPYARAIAKHIGSDHHEYYLSADDGLKLIDSLPHTWDEPFADASQIPSLLVAQMARQKVTVCLTGDGGDELFCGYNRYFLSQQIWDKQKRVPMLFRDIAGRFLTKVPPRMWQSAYQTFKRFTLDKHTQANFGLKVHKFAELLRMTSQREAYRYLLSSWQHPEDLLSGANEAVSILDREPSPQLGSFINTAMYWDQLGYLVDDNLVKGDRSSMAYSLEARLPLLDHRIVEFSWRLPMNMKYRDGASKWILRKTLDRYVPKALIERPKMGFSVPVGEWLKGPLKQWAGDLLFSNHTISNSYTNKKEIEKIWTEHQKGQFDHAVKIWTFCMWQQWCHKY